jgi:phytoene dehydrogenase-like protein
MLETLEEELKDASGKGADYFEKKAEIETMVISLNDCKSKIDKIDEEFPSFEDKIEEYVALTRDNKEIDNLKKVV